jgi:hypothetical protein
MFGLSGLEPWLYSITSTFQRNIHFGKTSAQLAGAA